MPCTPSHVEKLRNHNANATTSPPTSATWPNKAGSSPNNAVRGTSRSFTVRPRVLAGVGAGDCFIHVPDAAWSTGDALTPPGNTL